MITTLVGRAHIAALGEPLARLEDELDRLGEWGQVLASTCSAGGRLLVVGNGGSAAEAQHLTAELVGRFEEDREPLSAIALHAETSSLTAIANDYGAQTAFARQVRAHGRAGDILVSISTSGASPNVVAAAEAANDLGLLTWALTGPRPNPLADASDDAVAVEADRPSTVQEIHLVAIHLLCAAVDSALRTSVPQ
ncbi:MAG TPA: SIS domain-containing protein [Gaiella sp.]|nr:SIS domain-containing protein [Gaiella sp.]